MNTPLHLNAAARVLPADTTLGAATLSVADLDRSVSFYSQVIGFKLLDRTGDYAVMGVDSPVIILKHKPGAVRQPAFSTGLYHVAILLPSRVDLAHAIMHLAQIRYPMEGYSDHNVSEAFYLADPDGNGLEIYRDKPRSAWNFINGQLAMANAPIDLDDFFGELGDNPPPFEGLAVGTRVGHMHLRVGNTDRAVKFYSEVIGFEVMQLWSGAGFVSAGGYHHHLGLNMWQSRGASAPPPNSAGLEEWTINLPSLESLDQAIARLDASEQSYARDGADVLVRDPWETKVRITVRS